MNDNVISIPRKNASSNIFELETTNKNIDIDVNVNTNTWANKSPNIKMLNYQDLFDHIKLKAILIGEYFEYKFVKNGINVTLCMRSIKSISDYLFRYWNDTNIYYIKDKESDLDQKID